jgi:hypothetical protein
MTPTITAAQLEKHNACPDQVALFRETFGESTTVTVAKAKRVASLFDWDWAARRFLGAAAFAEYDKARAPAWAEYEKVRAAALAEYEKVRAAALAEYKKACAPAFATAYIKQEKAR